MMAYAGKLANCGPFAARQTGNQPDRMIVSGVVVSATAVAVLARCLQRAGHNRLADDVGLALDADWHELVLAPNEAAALLDELKASGRRWLSGTEAPREHEPPRAAPPEPEADPEPDRRGWLSRLFKP